MTHADRCYSFFKCLLEDLASVDRLINGHTTIHLPQQWLTDEMAGIINERGYKWKLTESFYQIAR